MKLQKVDGFLRWVFEVLLPWLSGDDPFTVTGDNLGSNFNRN